MNNTEKIKHLIKVLNAFGRSYYVGSHTFEEGYANGLAKAIELLKSEFKIK